MPYRPPNQSSRMRGATDPSHIANLGYLTHMHSREQGILERRERYLNAPYVVVLQLIRGPRLLVSALLLILRPL
jgi:hypothetical protein